MSQIILIASGDSIAHYGKILQQSLPDSRSIQIVNGYMEAAVDYARHQMPEDTDVIIARGNTAKLLKSAHLTVPVVTIPITDSDLVHSIQKAQTLYGGANSQIAYIGMEDVIRSVQAFLDILNCDIRLYPVTSSQDIEYSIKRAKKEQIHVVIGGQYTQKLAEEYGLKSVLLESSLNSLKEAYDRALEVQKGVQLQKKKLQERLTMIHSIFDGIVSINEKRKVTLCNPSAEKYLKLSSSKVIGKSYTQLFEDTECALINQVLLSGQSAADHPFTLHGTTYLLSVHPVMVHGRNKGVILSLHPYQPRNIRQTEPSILPTPKYSFSSFFDLTGNAPAFRQAVSLGLLYARSDEPVLIIGEDGTGRETFAHCIHCESSRKNELFLAREASLLNTEDLLAASQGTLYIRSIENLSQEMTAVLIDVLRTHTIFLPDSRTRQNLDFRLIAGSSVDLSKQLAGSLYYLIHSLLLPLPSLAQRKEDIIPLFFRYLGECRCTDEPEIRELLMNYDWPGNIRQLQGICRRLVLLCLDNGIIDKAMLKYHLDDSGYFAHLSDMEQSVSGDVSKASPETFPKIPSPVQSSPEIPGFIIHNQFVSWEELNGLDRYYHGKKSLIASHLGISRSTLWRYLKEMEESRK